MRNDLRYATTDCFETFPFPVPDPRTLIPELEAIGDRLYITRAQYMVDTDQGLTKTYNALKDPDCTEPRILELRQLHEDMDRAVLAAYGWSDVAVPPYCPKSDADRAALQAFEDAVIDRLFALNEQRAAAERAAAKQTGTPAAGRKPGKAKSKKAAAPSAEASNAAPPEQSAATDKAGAAQKPRSGAKPAKRGKPSPPSSSPQGSLPGLEGGDG